MVSIQARYHSAVLEIEPLVFSRLARHKRPVDLDNRVLVGCNLGPGLGYLGIGICIGWQEAKSRRVTSEECTEAETEIMPAGGDELSQRRCVTLQPAVGIVKVYSSL